MTSRRKRGASAGENRFLKSQQANVLTTSTEISSVINLLRTQKVFFRNISHLASYVASVISNNRGSNSAKMAVSTLTRNYKYRALLDSYLIATASNDTNRVINSLVNDLNASEIVDLRLENSRLKKFIQNNNKISSGETIVKHAVASPYSNSSLAHNNLCRAISLILESCNGQFVVDQDVGEIVNTWARSIKNRVVVPKDIAKEFIEWYKSFPEFINQ